MDQNLRRKVICALDTGSLDEAISTIERVKPYAGAFKIGHALTLPHGLKVLEPLAKAGATRIFLDLKFHDTPNTVGIAVREAAKYGVWMLTLHIAGGPAMIAASVEEANAYSDEKRTLLLGVSVLTSLDQSDLARMGVNRPTLEHMEALSTMGIEAGLDGVVTSVEECSHLRKALPHSILVTPGIRAAGGELGGQRRVGDAKSAIEAGADYLVIGRALTGAADPAQAAADLGLIDSP